MKFPLLWIDAFTDRVFAGNPAAVVPLDSWPDDTLLQHIAAENGLSETAFFVRRGPAHFHLRWFTPTVEMLLCGHATLATAHVLFHELPGAGDRIVFDSLSGPLAVERRADGKLELDFPAQPVAPAAPPPGIDAALGRAPVAVFRNSSRWLCTYERADEVRALRPDFARVLALQPGRVVVTAPGDDCDFVSRFFAPEIGIPEDPVTGGAHCALVPHWAARLGKSKLHARQLSARGGELWCEVAGDRVKIAGHAVLYLRGEISV